MTITPLWLSASAFGADDPSLAAVDSAIEQAEAQLTRTTDADPGDLDEAREELTKARQARDDGELEAAAKLAGEVNVELEKMLAQ